MPAGSASTSLSITNPLVLYRALVATKRIRPDPAQHRLALQLQKLYYRLKDYDPELEYRHRIDQISRAVDQQSAGLDVGPPRSGSQRLFSSLWRNSLGGNVLALTRTVPIQESAIRIESPQGMLLYGEVGRGKSMLLDLLFDSLPSHKKRRWHFNTFMLDIFRRLEAGRIQRTMPESGLRNFEHEHLVLSLAKDTVATSPILFLDEFQLPDRTSSKLLNGFLNSFFHLGGVLVASSNRMPEELAKAAGVEFPQRDVMGSLFGWTRGRSAGQRAAQSDFAQFLEVLKARCEVWEMEGERDWRRESENLVEDGAGAEEDADYPEAVPGQNHGSTISTNVAASSFSGSSTRPSADTPPHYHISFPDSSSDSESSKAHWSGDVQTVNPQQTWRPSIVHVFGRRITIPQASYQPPGIAMFSFPVLCASYLGPADYITLASNFHTLVLTDVPVLTLLQKNEARRFITLLDALYESKCRLLIQAAAPPDSLFFPETLRRRGNDRLEQREKNDGGSESVYQEMFSEIYQDSSQPFRPNVSTYAEDDSAATPTQRLPGAALRSVLADEDADFGPTYGNGRSQGLSGGESGMADTMRRQQQVGPDFTKTNLLTGEDERFAYKRARSRLWEMCGNRWWSERQGRNVEEWWRPVRPESRHWEGRNSGPAQAAAAAVVVDSGAAAAEQMVDASHDGTARRSDSGRLFTEGVSPFRTRSDLPPQLPERHVWGLGLWGPKAGRWGRGETKEKEEDAPAEDNGGRGEEKRRS